MKNQKICIIGDGLAGLTTALVLSNLNLDVDLYLGKKSNKTKVDQRITAISTKNYNFLKKYIGSKNLKHLWPCNNIKLYHEENEKKLNFLNFNDKKNLMYIFENHKLKKVIRDKLKINKINKINLIYKTIKKTNIKKNIINSGKSKISYDIVVLCLGAKSEIYENLLNERAIYKNYFETAITCKINHKTNIVNPRQYFLKEGPLAILPFKKNIFSIVWSIDEKLFANNKNNLKKLIGLKLKNLLGKKNNFIISKIQSYPIKLNLETKYYNKNTLILGEGIHSVHPLAGQGFNLVLRDIEKFCQLLKNNLNLGLDINNSGILKEFNKSRKPENIILGLGIDFTNYFFKYSKYLEPFKNKIIKNLNTFEILKKLSKDVSNKGLF